MIKQMLPSSYAQQVCRYKHMHIRGCICIYYIALGTEYVSHSKVGDAHVCRQTRRNYAIRRQGS